MAKRIHGNATGAIEIALPIIRNKPAVFAPHESEVSTAIGLHHSGLGLFRRSRHGLSGHH